MNNIRSIVNNLLESDPSDDESVTIETHIKNINKMIAILNDTMHYEGDNYIMHKFEGIMSELEYSKIYLMDKSGR